MWFAPNMACRIDILYYIHYKLCIIWTHSIKKKARSQNERGFSDRNYYDEKSNKISLASCFKVLPSPNHAEFNRVSIERPR